MTVRVVDIASLLRSATGAIEWPTLLGSVAAVAVTAVLAHRFWVRQQAWSTIYAEKRSTIRDLLESLNRYIRTLHHVEAVIEASRREPTAEVMHYLWLMQRRFGPDPTSHPSRPVRLAMDSMARLPPPSELQELPPHLRTGMRNLLLTQLVDDGDDINLQRSTLLLHLRDPRVADAVGRFVDEGIEAAFAAAKNDEEFVQDFMLKWRPELDRIRRELRRDLAQSSRGLWWATRVARVRPWARRATLMVRERTARRRKPNGQR